MSFKFNSNFFKKIKINTVVKYLPFIVSAVIFCVILLMSMLNNFQLKEQMTNTYYQFAYNKLDKVKTDNENQKSSIKNLCLQISFNDELHKLFLKQPDSITINYVANQLKSYASFVNGINSINIFDGRKSILYSPSGQYSADSYSGIPMDELNGGISYVLKEFHIETSEGNKLIYSYTMEDTNNIIIIDIDTEKYYRNFANYNIENNSFLTVVNKKNQVVYCSDPEISPTVLPHTDKYKLIAHKGTDYICFSINSSLTEYTYTTFIPYNLVIKSVAMQKNYYFIVIILIVVLLTTIISYLSTLKIKAPLMQLLNKSDLYDYHKYNDEIKKNQRILKNYITTEFPSSDEIRDVYDILKEEITESSNSLTLLSFTYDENANKKVAVSKKEFEALFFGISNICTEVVSNYSKVQCTYDTDKSIILICANINFDSEKLEMAARECVELVKTHLDVSISAEVGLETDFEQLYDSYQKIIKIRNYKYIYGTGNVLNYDVTAEKKSSVDNEKHLRQKIFSDFNDNNFPSAYKELEKYIEILKKMSVEQVRILITEFTLDLINYLKKQEISEKNEENFDQITFFNNVNKAETIDEVKIYIENAFSHLALLQEKKENSYYEKIVSQVNEIIEKYCCDVNFSPNTVAENLKLSIGYLNRIYRQKSGDTLTNFILKKRLENATRLLLDTAMPIKEIAFKSGFMSDSYFILLFKKQFGCTPSNYRSTYKKG